VTINYKKIFSILMVMLVAVVTGFSIGKIYLDSTTTTTEIVLESQKELSADEKEVKRLYESTLQGKSVMEFSGMELYQIAEYKLNNSPKFLKEMLGEVLSVGQLAILKGQKFKDEKGFVYYKLSPAKKIMAGLSTPNICTRIEQEHKALDKIKYSIGDLNCFIDTSSKENLDAKLKNPSISNYTEEEYEKNFKTTPRNSVLYYIISDKTCSKENVSEIRDNGNGTYSFDIMLSGSKLSKAALHYTYDVLFTCGYPNPSLSWDSMKMTVSVDSNFNFTQIVYNEKYTIASEGIPVLKKAGVEDNFVDCFYFDEKEIIEHSITDYKVLRGIV